MNQPEIETPVKYEGFDRVIVDREGVAVPHHRAEQMGFTPTVGFLREDGWSLGAPAQFEMVAYRMWPDEWTHRIDLPASEWRKI